MRVGYIQARGEAGEETDLSGPWARVRLAGKDGALEANSEIVWGGCWYSASWMMVEMHSFCVALSCINKRSGLT